MPLVPVLSTDRTVVLFGFVWPTTNVVFRVSPPLKVILAEPSVSPTIKFEMFNEPASEEKLEFAISVSPADRSCSSQSMSSGKGKPHRYLISKIFVEVEGTR